MQSYKTEAESQNPVNEVIEDIMLYNFIYKIRDIYNIKTFTRKF